MDYVVAVLRADADKIVDDALAALERSRLQHYVQDGAGTDRERLQRLFDTVVDCIDRRQLVPIVEYAEQVAHARSMAGFDIAEVQTGFNVLEEAVWRHVVATAPPEELAEAVGLLSTVLGVGKDALARTYVSLATKAHVHSLDFRPIFAGDL